MTKSKTQLDAEIAEALRERKSDFRALVKKIEAAVDAHPELTRQRLSPRGLAEEAELIFRGGGWVVAECAQVSDFPAGMGDLGVQAPGPEGIGRRCIDRRGDRLRGDRDRVVGDLGQAPDRSRRVAQLVVVRALLAYEAPRTRRQLLDGSRRSRQRCV